jgi:pre-mRNA-processing factor 19
MFCAISGSVPNEPVVNKKSGHLFERKLVEKYIQETGGLLHSCARVVVAPGGWTGCTPWPSGCVAGWRGGSAQPPGARAAAGKDPVTQEEATLDDLLPLASNKLVKPRPSAAASIPGAGHWRAVVLCPQVAWQLPCSPGCQHPVAMAPWCCTPCPRGCRHAGAVP